MKKITKILVLASIIITSACGTSTKIVGSWTNKEQKITQFEKVGIAALYPNESSRYLIERAVEKEFKEKNIKAMATYEVWPMAGRIGENPDLFKNSEKMHEALRVKVREKIKEQNMDAVMFITLLDTKKEERYVNNNNYYGGTGYYGGPLGVGYYGSPHGAYYNYYAYSVGTIYDTGYYVEDVTYFLEAQLFDVKNGMLIWTGRTKTVKLESVEQEAVNFAKLIVNDIVAKKVIVP
ncbi:MAG TPA: hypothetical protein VK872_09210 [Draconibacterium sp.]|nr:hypothetical protein [Draconibacterium sp.]